MVCILKKTWQKALLCGGVFLSLTMSAYAAELYADGYYRVQDQTLTVEGTVDAPNTALTMTVIPYDTDLSQITIENAEEEILAVSALNADLDGKFSVAIGLPASKDGGLYKAVLRYAGEENEVWFSYLKSQAAAPVLQKINTAANAAAIKTILSDGNNASDIGMESTLTDRYGDIVSTYLYQNRPKSGYRAEDFAKYSIGALAMGQVMRGNETPATVINRFSADLGLSYVTEVAPYNKAVQTETVRLMQKTAWDNMTFADFYRRSLLLARINAAGSNLSLKEIVLDNKDVLGLSMSGYLSLDNEYQKNQVYTIMMGNKYESYQAVANAFSAACLSAASGSTGGTGGSAGGGGGGGISGGGGGINSGVITNVPEKNEEDTQAERFTDMKNHWAKDEVTRLAEKGILSGFPDGSFGPDRDVTRAEFSKMLSAVLDIKENKETAIRFADVGDADWYAPYVLALAENGIINGYDGKFLPDDAISRQDAAVMLERAAAMQGKSFDGTVHFDDEAQIADYAKSAVSSLSSAGIFKGYEGKFYPQDRLTRAEAAVMLARIDQLL